VIIRNRFEGIVRVLVTAFVIGTLFAGTLFTLAKSLQARPNSFDLGIEQILDQNFKEAIALFTQSINSKVNIPEGYANRCLAHLQLHEYDLALADCTIAINSPNNSESFLNRGLAYYNLGKYSQAIADFDRVLTTNNSDFRAYYNRGLAKFALNQLPQAIADYDLALNVIDYNLPEIQSEIYNERGLTYFFLKELDLALTNYNQAISTNPQSDRAYFNRGCTYQRQKNYALAAQDFSSAIAINSHSPEALMNRAIAFRQLGKKSQAISDLNLAAQEFLAQGLVDDYTYALDLAKQIGDRDSSAVV
jgi:tetratricopeptide (TPR) repeat protein